MQAPASELPPLPAFNGIARSDASSRAAYAEGAGIFRIVPGAIAAPSTTAALITLVKWAAEHGVPVIPRGAGSGMAGGNLGRGLILDLTSLDGAPLSIDPERRIARSGCAVTHRALAELAGRHGLRLPPDPSSARFATLGGMLATNASGPHSLHAGSVRNWVTGLDVVTSTGETLELRRGTPPPHHPMVERFIAKVRPSLLAARPLLEARFPRTRKNSSGYALDRWLETDDLIDLIVGSEGTLGIITHAEWRLEPIPPLSAGIRVALTDAAALDELIPQLLDLRPAALEYLDATFLEFAEVREGGEAGLLMLELEGEDAGDLKTRLDGARAILRSAATGIRSAYGALALDALWDVRHAASPMLARLGATRRSLQVIEDACVPVEMCSRYIAAVRAAGLRHGIQVVIFGHAGQGNLHVNLLPDVTATGWETRVAALFEEVSNTVIELGGTLSGEHGDGRLRAGMLARSYGADVMLLFGRIKQAFDPDGMLNPGVIIPFPAERPFDHLKVGDTAASLPDAIEQQLREIERTAGYGQFRLELASVR